MRVLSFLLFAIFLSINAFADHASDEQQFQKQIDNQPALPKAAKLAADSVGIEVPVIYRAHQDQNTKATVRFVNNDQNGHVVIAAYTPAAKQVQLRTVVKVGNRNVNVQIHSFALKLNSKTWLGVKQKHFALLDLKHSLHVGEMVPLTIIFRDGSYETVQAKVKA